MNSNFPPPSAGFTNVSIRLVTVTLHIDAAVSNVMFPVAIEMPLSDISCLKKGTCVINSPMFLNGLVA